MLVIGLDCVPPSIAFDRWRDELPHLASLLDRGLWGPLRSTVPPITVPAWPSMFSGRDPGELGLYGFRNRRRGERALALASSSDVRAKRVWDYLGDAGKRTAVLFVPLTSPPPPVRGHSISCFLGDTGNGGWTFPEALAAEITPRFGAYRPDVEDFRSDERGRVLDDLFAMADQHFGIARWVWREKRPDFLVMVEMGPDRLHHALWHLMDPTHPRYEPGNPWEARARAYYAHLDARLGELLEEAGEEATVMVVSDHGARPMVGGVRINEWLAQEGWLCLHERPVRPVPLDDALVDWSRTRAWGEGGYYARIFLNVRGRDPDGVIEPSRYDQERAALEEALRTLTGPDGRPLGNRVHRPEQLYRRVRGVPPDLMVFFGDLAYRSLGTVGGEPGVLAEANDTGPDACNHDWDGIFVMAGPGVPAAGPLEDLHLYDVTRTILGVMGVEPPEDLLGRDVRARRSAS